MDQDKIKSAGECSALKLDMSFGHDGGGDFSLPDYMPEIQRLLYVVPSVLPETKYLSGNTLEMGGSLTYSVVYLGDDGKIACTSLVSEYTADTVLSSHIDNIGEVFVDCEIENTACRVTGPRSINIKNRLRSRVMGDEIITDEKTVLDCEDKKATLDLAVTVERQTCDTSSVIRRHGMTTGSANGEMTVPDGERPVLCTGVLGVSHTEAVSDGINVKGEIYVKCLFSDGEVNDICRKTKIPFEITVPVNDVVLPAMSRAWGRTASVTVSSSDTVGSYVVSVEYDIEAESLSNCSITLCSDAYSTDVESTCDVREGDILDVISFGNGQLTVTGECDIKNSSENIRVADVETVTGPLQLQNSDGKSCVTGVLRVKAVFEEGGDYTSSESEIPYRYELNVLRMPEGSEMQSRVVCNVLSSSGKIIGGKLSLSAELCFSYEILEKKHKRFVTAVKLGCEKPHGAVGSGVKVYYPQSTESIWNVCKRYHASRSRILKVNGIDGDFVEGGKPVIIF